MVYLLAREGGWSFKRLKRKYGLSFSQIYAIIEEMGQVKGYPHRFLALYPDNGKIRE